MNQRCVTELNCGDRCITATGRTGEIIEPKWEMSLYHLIKFDDGSTFWILKELVSHAIEGDSKTTTPRRHSNRKDKQTARASGGAAVLQVNGNK
ncbi:MAG: hypothetical protein FWK01_21680 [Pantanalinema sp. GBBB05]|nr:hypothetical protein [Pantanalinema sp. GBBB05]